MTPQRPQETQYDPHELRAFLRILYRALRMLTLYLETKYGFGRERDEQGG